MWPGASDVKQGVKTATPLKGVVQRHFGLPRCGATSGAAALLQGVDQLHSSFLAVASFQDSPRPHSSRPHLSSSTPATLAHPALSLPPGLAHRRTQARDSSAPLGLQLYSLSELQAGAEREVRETAALPPPACLLVHTMPLPFAQLPSPHQHHPATDVKVPKLASTARDEERAKALPLAFVVEKVAWAGPCLLAVMNALGEVLVCRTGLSYLPVVEDEEDDRSSDEGSENGSRRGDIVQRFSRVVDVAAASAVSACSEVVSAVCVAGLRTLQTCAVWTDRRTGAAMRSEPRGQEWALGPFHSVALFPDPGRPAKAEKGSDGTAAFLLAACSMTGTVQVFAWDVATAPIILGQVLLGPQTAFWGISAGVAGARCVFVAMGATSTSSSSPVTATAPAGQAGSIGESSLSTALSLTSLKGKDGKPLAVGDLLTAADAHGALPVSRQPLNAVRAMLRRHAKGPTAEERTVFEAEAAADTLDVIAPAVLVAPPALSFSGIGIPTQDVFVLTLCIDTAPAEALSSDEASGASTGSARRRCVTRYCSLRASPQCVAALGEMKGSPSQLLPFLAGSTRAAVGGQHAFYLIVHSKDSVLSLAVSLAGDTLRVSPAAFHSVHEGCDGCNCLVGVDVCTASRSGQDSCGLLLLSGCATEDTVEAPTRDEGSAERRNGNGVAISSLSLSLLSANSSRWATEQNAAVNSDVELLSHGASSPQLLHESVRAVIQEESAKLLAQMNERMERLEEKLDRLLRCVEESNRSLR